MIIGVGTDIIEIARIDLAITRQEQFIQKVFTPAEQNYCNCFKNSSMHYAGRYAAKEAVLKAAGTGLRSPLTWLDIEILNNNEGQPQAYLSGELSLLLKGLSLHVSISHCKDYATACVILERRV